MRPHILLPLTLLVLSACNGSEWKAYDKDTTQQCMILKDAYPEPFSVDELEKVREYINSKDPEMLRSYLLGLAKAKQGECLKEAGPLGRLSPKIIEWNMLVTFCEEWVKPSPEGRMNYAMKRQEPYRDMSGNLVELEYTMSAEGRGSATLVMRSKRPGVLNAQMRDVAIMNIKSGKKENLSLAAVGFTAYRMENPEGKGFTFKVRPQGFVLPLLADDFK